MTTQLNFEGLANGVAFSATTILAGSDAVSAVLTTTGGGTILADWDNEVYGTSAVDFNANGNLCIARFLLPGTGSTEYGDSLIFQYPDHVPNVDLTIHSFRAGDTTTGTVNYRLKILGTAAAAPGSVAAAFGSSGNFSLATAAQMTPLGWYRAEEYIKQGTTATNGDARVKLYPWNSNTIVAGSTSVSLSGTATVPLTNTTVIEIGVGTILTAAMTMRYDLYRGAVQATEFGLPPSNALPVSNAGVNKTGTPGSVITMGGTASDADGTVTTHVWDFSEFASPTKPTLTNPNTATPSWSSTTPGRYTLTYHVVDNNGGISPETTAKGFIGTTTPKFIQIVSNTGAFAAVGAADILAAINDALDSSYAESVAGGGASTLRVRLEPMPVLTGFTLNLKSVLSVAGTETATVRFRDTDGTVRKTWDPTPTDVAATVPLTMNSTECATVVNWNECDIEFIWAG